LQAELISYSENQLHAAL